MPAVLVAVSLLALLPLASVHAETEENTFQEILGQIELILKSQLASLHSGQVQGAETIVVNTDAELHAALLKVTGGETIQLNPGTYGLISINETQYKKLAVGQVNWPVRAAKLTSTVTITSADPSRPAVIGGIKLDDTPYWRFEGLKIRPTGAITAVEIFRASNNVVTKNDIAFTEDSSSWSASDWNAKAGPGVTARLGNGLEISYNKIKNVDVGIQILHGTTNYKVIGNVIDTFDNDGLRGHGNNGLFEDNIVMNPLQVDGNHSDFFQSWLDFSNGKIVENVTVRHNTFLNYQKHPLSADTQGIGMFDGPYKNWTIENNLIITNHWHGISVFGAHDTKVRNNVVIDIESGTPGPAWILVRDDKANNPSVNAVVEENISNSVTTGWQGVTYLNNKNITYSDYNTYFEDWQNGDWEVKSGALAFAVGARPVSTVSPPEPTPTPTPSPTPTPTPNPDPEEEEVVKSKIVHFKLLVPTKVYVYPGSSGSVTQPAGALGTYDAAIASVKNGTDEYIKVEFKEGAGGFMLKSDLPRKTPRKSTEEATTTVQTLLLKDNLNVRTEPGGSILAIQSKGTKGTLKLGSEIEKDGRKWIFVDFATGEDGYVAAEFVSFTTTLSTADREAILAKIKVLLAKIVELQEKLKKKQAL